MSNYCKLPDLMYNIISFQLLERKPSMKRVLSISLCFLILLISFPQEIMAQDSFGQFLKDIGKDVVLDPTTYTPAAIYFTTKKLDWDSSQVFFKNGYTEENSDFTISGRANDVPVSQSAGNRRIVIKTLPFLESSLLNNVGVSVSERFLINSYPNHRKLIKSIGWVEKIAIASYFSYHYSTKSFHQWQTNNRMASELGLK